MTLRDDAFASVTALADDWQARGDALDTAAARVTALEATLTDVRALHEETRRLLTEAERRIADLEAELSPWVLLHDVDLTDPTGWSLRNETQSNDNSRNLPANVTFGPEGLRIVGKREPGYNRPYTSGDALGRGYELPNYFRVEVVGRGPHERGLWPCVLWLRPGNSSDGEIDLMENFGGQPRVKATLHNEYGATHKMIHGQLRWDTPEIASAGPPDGLHTYVCEKTPDRILITVDGVTLMDVGPDDAPAGFDWQRIFETLDRTWYPRVTLQLGCGTANPTCATGQPADTFTKTDMLVASLKMWTLR